MLTWTARRRSAARGTVIGLAIGLLVAGCGGAPTATAPPAAAPPTRQLYVSPTGSDNNDGSEGSPFKTIQAGLDAAQPGTVVNLAPGVYSERVETQRDGTAAAPIVIKGPETGKEKSGRYKATLHFTGRIFSINHSHYTLEGFTIDGEEQLTGTTFPTDFRQADAFKDKVKAKVEDSKLIYIGAADESRDITGVTVKDMFLSSAGTECVRLRNNAQGNSIIDSVIQYCGLFGKKKGDGVARALYHNGEGVYIGTSPKSSDQPMAADDGSSRNTVARNTIRTFGSECFNVKENAHDNVFEDNICSDNAESSEFQGSNIELRGHSNIIRNNQITNSAGVSLKIKSDDEKYDKGGNVVQGNRISGAPTALLFDSKAPPGAMCGNVVETQSVVSAEDTDDDAAPPNIAAPC
ncbi:DUF1565 domain-containing protein [Pseudonocardia sp. TRM90224]|uniref:DUF1565 domain-containing protein n=1 Tax=Pseudonocardia sp. TRM90224 TaxID=2812678 RepID=UPI001E52BD58|nr:DUF1565 domain-containing protein [Pseudonocardia sp. TRM90224]